MKTVIIDKATSLTVTPHSIKLGTVMIPFKLIDTLILTADVTLSAKDILTLTNDNIAILYISKNSARFSLTLPQIAKNSDLKLMQYRATTRSIDIAKAILYEKFTTHQAQLANHNIDFDITDSLAHLALAKSIDELMGIEGSFARAYFARYFDLFPKGITKGFRSKQPPLDPANALLSFVYTIVHNQITAKLYFRGFEPSISFLHTPFRSHYALSSDVIEILRAPINDFVLSLFKANHITHDDFTKTGDAIYLKQTSRRTLWTHLKPFLDSQATPMNTAISMIRKRIVHDNA